MKKLLALIMTVAMLITSALFIVPAQADEISLSGLSYRGGGGSGLSLSGNTVNFNRAADGAGHNGWSNVQLMNANDDAKDGFTVKISDIVWDENNDNAVAIVYGNNPSYMSCINVEGGYSNFTLLVRKDGSIVFWGNGCNSNHIWGKWAGVYSTGKTLGETVTEFTYKMVPSADLSKFDFYVNDLLVYTYDIATVAAASASFHTSSVLANLDTPCNFGFQVLNGTGSWGNGWGTQAYGTLSYKIAGIDSVGSIDFYPLNDLYLRAGGGTGLSVSGNTVNFNHPAPVSGTTPLWSNAELIANDDPSDGFTVKIKDIVWDEANDNAVAVTYSNASNPYVASVSDTASNFTLLVRKDGSLVFWGNGCNSNHTWGKWAGVYSTGKTLGETVTEFTYKMVPNADKSAFSFYVNDLLVYTYDIATVAGTSSSFHYASILNNLDKPCNFGFMVMNGTGNWASTGWGTEPIGTLSYTVDKILMEGSIDFYPLDGLYLRAGGGTGLSVSGNTVNFNHPAPVDGTTPLWSNAQLMVSDDASDGFSVKIKDIVWDEANDNAVAVIYSNASNPYVASVSDTESNFTLLVRKDGSIVFWGNGCNSNHFWGKWAGVYSTDKTLGKQVTEFTYSMVPNSDKSAYSFYVNDVLVYTYDIATVAGASASFHSASILANIGKPCNFGFMVLNGTGNWGSTGWGTQPIGTLSYTVDKIEKAGSVPVVEPEIPAIDYAELNAEIARADGLDETLYKAASLAAMKAVYDRAAALVDNAADQAEVAAMTAELKAAIDALALKSDLTALNAEIARADALDESAYKADSFAAMKEIYNAAIALTAEDEQTDIDAAAAQLAAAIGALELKPAVKYEGECGEGITWAIDVEGTLTISGNGAMNDYTRSTMPWYKMKDEVVKVVIEDGVTNVGAYAFYNHTNLVAKEFAESVVTIGKNAFKGSQIALGTCGDGIVWTYDADTKTLNICGVGAMADYTRSSMPWAGLDVDTVVLCDSVTYVGAYAFYNFGDIAITMNGVTGVGKNAFKGTNVPAGACGDNLSWKFDAATGALYIGGTGAMYDYTRSSMPWYQFKDAITAVYLDTGVTSVGAYAFYNFANLETASIGSAAIGKNAFKGTAVPMGACGDNVTWAFDAATGKLTIAGEGAMADYTRSSMPWYSIKDAVTSVEIADGVTYVGAYAFYNFANLAEANYAEGTEIGNKAFFGTAIVEA